jgi:hypothetical protein
MDSFERWSQGVRVRFEAYTEEEAKERGLEYKSWRSAPAGTWAVTDDGWVLKVLSRRGYVRNKKTVEMVTLSGARAFNTKYQSCVYGPRRITRNYTALTLAPWDVREASSRRTKAAVKVYVAMMLLGKINWEKLGEVYRPNNPMRVPVLKKLMKRDRIRKMIDKELHEQLKEQGMDTDYVLQTLKDAINIAKAKKDPSNMLRGAEDLMDIHGMKADTKKALPAAEFQIPAGLMESIDRAAASLPPTREPEEADYEVIDKEI